MSLYAGTGNYSTQVSDIHAPLELGAPTSELAFYGAAANPTGDPVGGGPSYRRIATSGDYRIKTRQELLDALAQSSTGQVVYVEPDAEIDLSGLMRVTVPSGVTLAGNRGQDGAPGPLLFTDEMPPDPYPVLIDVLAGKTRVTGLRIRGPSPDYPRQREGTDGAWRGVRLEEGTELDNCEISHFSRDGVVASARDLGSARPPQLDPRRRRVPDHRRRENQPCPD
jgi:hypothetical protein